ncbi:MAG: hypothetical protein O3A00_14315 [Planctomycetota bacterium]|nr:hypothetical protein [Planctomycetota bacterium]
MSLRLLCVGMLVVGLFGQGWTLAQKAEKPAKTPVKKPAEPPKQTALKISKETTFITSPLDKKGFVNYVRALDEMHGKGVKPEDNAAVFLARGNGIRELANSPHRERYFKAMGIEPVKVGGETISWLSFAKDFPETAKLENPALWDRRAKGRERPWTAKDDFVLAKWVEANDKAIDLFVRASKCSRYYTPYLDTDEAVGAPKVLAILLPVAQESREAVRMLTIRAMYRLGNDDVEGAFEDNMAARRLGQLVSQGGTIIEVLVGIACNAIAGEVDQAISRHPKLTSKQALRFRKHLEAMKPIESMADKIDTAERFMMLDVATSMVRDGPGALNQIDGGDGESNWFMKMLTRASIDWNEVTKIANTWYDRLTAALRKPTRKERLAALSVIDAQIKAAAADARDKRSLVFAFLSRQRRSEVMTNVLVALLLPAVTMASEASDRSIVQLDLIRLAYAIEAFQRDNQKFPKSLSDLAPKYIAKVPQDLFADGPMRYTQYATGFHLYSVGRNGKDDGGESQEFNQESDDLVVRNPPFVKTE